MIDLSHYLDDDGRALAPRLSMSVAAENELCGELARLGIRAEIDLLRRVVAQSIVNQLSSDCFMHSAWFRRTRCHEMQAFMIEGHDELLGRSFPVHVKRSSAGLEIHAAHELPLRHTYFARRLIEETKLDADEILVRSAEAYD
jgi:hypothetical protein